MKRICFLLLTMTLAMGAPTAGRAQDAATEQRLNELSGKIEEAVASLEAQHKQIAALAKEIENLRDQQTKPNASYASQEDLQRLADAVEKIDHKRMDDYEKIRAELQKLGQSVKEAVVTPVPRQHQTQRPTPAPTQDDTAAPTTPEHGIAYEIQSGDTLSAIVKACKEKGIKVTVDEILKANPKVKANRLQAGQKIMIPVK